MSKERITVEITNAKLTAAIWRTYGMAVILEALKECREKYPKLPGLEVAVLTAESICADARVAMAGYSVREVAKAGHDISQFNVYTDITKSIPTLYIESIDLVEMADAP